MKAVLQLIVQGGFILYCVYYLLEFVRCVIVVTRGYRDNSPIRMY